MNGTIAPGDDWNSRENANDFLKSLPWFILALASQLRAEQWQALITGQALLAVRREVDVQVHKALAKYPSNFKRAWHEDITDEVLLKLIEGKFLKRYKPILRPPMAYVLGSAHQYARTLARSYWRRYGRDGA